MDSEEIIQAISYYVEEAIEYEKLDFKLTWNYQNPRDLGEFAKDITAIANSEGDIGYIVIGVRDIDQRKDLRNPKDPNEYIEGFNPPDVEVIKQKMTQIATQNISPQILLSYRSIAWPQTNKIIGVVVIPTQNIRPYIVCKDVGDQKSVKIWCRSGSHSMELTQQVIIKMIEDQALSLLKIKESEKDGKIQQLTADIEDLNHQIDRLVKLHEIQIKVKENTKNEEVKNLLESHARSIMEKEAEIARLREMYIDDNRITEEAKRIWKEIALEICLQHTNAKSANEGHDFVVNLLIRKGFTDAEVRNWLKIITM